MTVDIRVESIKPIRNTFGHIARRFGDKPASRYQEGTFDLQTEGNRHYKPLWDPDRDLYDKRRTAIEMKDWYALKDPRQYYYGAWTIARAKLQDAADRQMEFLEKRKVLASLPAADRQTIVATLLPLRHYEWGANTNLCLVSAYGWGTAITQAASMATMDRLGMAQHLSRIGLLLDGNTGTTLDEAKTLWLESEAWQPMRRQTERLMATRDWFEVLVAQALVADGLVYPLFFQAFDDWFAQRQGSGLSGAIDHQWRWYEESAKWVDAVMKTAAADSPTNRTRIADWVVHWRSDLLAALWPLAQQAMGEDGAAALGKVDDALSARLKKLGLQA